MRITGEVKVIDIPDDVCLTTVRELFLLLEKHLAVEFGVERITNVVVSSEEPATTDTDVIWFRLDNSGNFRGIYVYVQGQWLQMFPPPESIIKMYGDSRDIPPGYQLITNDTAGFTTAMVTKLQTEWLLAPAETHYVIFHVVYVGL